MKTKLFLFLIIGGLLFPHLCFAKTTVVFNGNLDLVNKECIVSLNHEDRGNISAKIVKGSKSRFDVSVNIDHFKIALVNLSSELRGSLEIRHKKDGDLFLLGKIWSQNSLVNYKPNQEFSGSFELRDRKLIFNSLSLGGISSRGEVQLFKPFKIDLTFKLASVSIRELLLLIFEEIDKPCEGVASGTIEVSGQLNSVLVRGDLESYDGILDDLEYEVFKLRFESIYPVAYIRDSKITRKDGVIFLLDGTLNLDDKENFDLQIDALKKSPLVDVDGSSLEWTFKRIKEKDASSKTEIKYLLKKNEDLGSDEDQVEMFRIERSIEF